jgi:hypothetical protein
MIQEGFSAVIKALRAFGVSSYRNFSIRQLLTLAVYGAVWNGIHPIGAKSFFFGINAGFTESGLFFFVRF